MGGSAGRRVLMVSWDGTDDRLLQALLDRGDLPVLAGLLEQGRRGALCCDQELSDVATWSSFATCWAPDRHGWVDVAHLDPDSYTVARLFREHVEGVPFWQHLSDAGRTVTVLDVPKAPMGQGLNGAEVADWVSHLPNLVGHVHADPPELAAEVVDRFGPDHGPDCAATPLDRVSGPVAAAERRLDQIVALTVDQLAARDADFVLTVLGSAHCLGHGLWHRHHGPEPGDPLADHYRRLDDALGRILGAAGDGWTVVVFSNRGMTGYLSNPDLTDDVLLRLDGAPPAARRRRLLVRAWQRCLPLRLRRALPGRWHRAARRGADEARSRRPWFAVPTGSLAGGVRVNLAGRESAGTVAPEDLDVTLDRIADAFTALVDLDTGEPAVESVTRRADRWPGPHADRLPDLYVNWVQRPSRGVRSDRVGEVRRHRQGPLSGHHTPVGWLVAAGPGIAPGPIVESIDVCDLGPTIGSLLGVPIPDADGAPVEALFAG